MPTTAIPLPNHWYQDVESGRSFNIVTVDEENDSIEVQYLNGDLGEFDFASWYESSLTPIEAPEDWSAPFDDVERDDLGYSDPDLHLPNPENLTLNDLLDDDDRY